MEPANSRFNPFALLISPEAVLAALERSSSLGKLGSRIRRPLDERLARLQANQEAQVTFGGSLPVCRGALCCLRSIDSVGSSRGLA